VHELDAFIDGLPKAELHMHLEGSLEPGLVIGLARRNGVDLPWSTADELRAAYRFKDLSSFLELYWAGCRVLVREEDFHAMTTAYLRQAHADGVLHAEVFVGMQNFTRRGISVETVMRGILAAFAEAEADFGMTAGLMVIAQRQFEQATGFELLDKLLPWTDRIAAIGYGGPEVGHPPSKFAEFFHACRERGLRIVIHAGEEGPASYVREAMELGADRIDHGVAAASDPALVRELAERGIALTVCPLSNLRLGIVPSLEAHPLKDLMDRGVRVTINSDDPTYFRGTINDNFKACRAAVGLTKADIVQAARTSFAASFLDAASQRRCLSRLDAYVESTAAKASR
jgi:adenosine deaminase